MVHNITMGHSMTGLQVGVLHIQRVERSFLSGRLMTLAGHRLSNIADEGETGVGVQEDCTGRSQLLQICHGCVDTEASEFIPGSLGRVTGRKPK